MGHRNGDVHDRLGVGELQHRRQRLGHRHRRQARLGRRAARQVDVEIHQSDQLGVGRIPQRSQPGLAHQPGTDLDDPQGLHGVGHTHGATSSRSSIGPV